MAEQRGMIVPLYQEDEDTKPVLGWPEMVMTPARAIYNMLQPGYDYSNTDQAARDAFDAVGLAPIVGGATIGAFGALPTNAVGAAGAFTRARPDPLKRGTRQRNMFPGVYKDPREIVEAAAAQVAPEDPALKQLFGVTRDDLFEINEQGARKGTTPIEDVVNFKKNPRGAEATVGVKTDRNAQRIRDVIETAREQAPDLYKGMASWYVMDPLFDRFKALTNDPAAAFNRFNTATGVHSPMSDVLTEINRGSAAYHANAIGDLQRYLEMGGKPAGWKAKNYPEMAHVMGHPAHSTSQAPAFGKFLEQGDMSFMQSPKVPAYVAASGVPVRGVPFQTSGAVPDAHWTRAVGLPDTRTGNVDLGSSSKLPEYQSLHGWWKDKVSDPLGIEAVPAQAIAWGAFGPQTGVETAIGAPKLELLAQQIMKTAARTGDDPERVMIDMIQGRRYVGANAAPAPTAIGAFEEGPIYDPNQEIY